MTLKLAKDLRFWGIDINVFIGDLSTLSLRGNVMVMM